MATISIPAYVIKGHQSLSVVLLCICQHLSVCSILTSLQTPQIGSRQMWTTSGATKASPEAVSLQKPHSQDKTKKLGKGIL